MGRLVGVSRIDTPGRIVEVDRAILLEKLHIRFPQRFDGPHILPVPVKFVSVHRLIPLDHGGYDILAKIIGGSRILLILRQIKSKLIPAKHIYPHGGFRRLGVGWLFFKLIDPIILIGIHDSKAAGLLEGDIQHRDGAGGFLLLVKPDHLRIIHFVDVIP